MHGGNQNFWHMRGCGGSCPGEAGLVCCHLLVHILGNNVSIMVLKGGLGILSEFRSNRCKWV